MQQKTATNTVWYGECLCLLHCKHLYSWRRITQTIGIPSKIQKISIWNWCSTYLRNWYTNNQMRSMEWKQSIGKEVFICGWWWTSHQSLAHKELRIFRFCIVSWKDERGASIKHCMGRKIDVVQKFTRVQNFGQNWWWANGIRVEYLPRVHHIAALHRSPRVTVKIERNTRKIHRTDYLHVDVQRHLMEI